MGRKAQDIVIRQHTNRLFARELPTRPLFYSGWGAAAFISIVFMLLESIENTGIFGAIGNKRSYFSLTAT